MGAWKGGWIDRADDEREIFKETVILARKKKYIMEGKWITKGRQHEREKY